MTRTRRTRPDLPGARAPWIRLALAVSMVISFTVAATTLWLLRDPLPRFADRRSSLVASVEGPEVRSAGHASREIRLEAATGLTIELLVRYPRASGQDGASASGPAEEESAPDAVRPRPLFLILGGYRTGDRAATLLDDTGGAVVAAMSYPYDGPLDVKGLEVVRHVPRIRSALFDTPPAVQLALDYLTARPDVDPARVELVGVSFGAPFTTIAAALDDRVSRLWLIHGAGRPFTLLEHNLRGSVSAAPLRALVAALANVLSAGPRLAPERWVSQVAPRPVMMINATDDERLPRSAVEALFASAREPKEQIWLPGPHVRSNREDVIRGLVDVVLSRASEDDGATF